MTNDSDDMEGTYSTVIQIGHAEAKQLLVALAPLIKDGAEHVEYCINTAGWELKVSVDAKRVSE